MKRSFLTFITISIFFVLCTTMQAQSPEFKVIANNSAKRALVTDTLQSGNFVVGVNHFGGGYITEIGMPGLGNVMGSQAQRYGRGGQSSIRDLARGGQYNPTQAGYSDLVGTECDVTKTHGKIVVNPRGCALYNSDGHFDYARWENIKKDPFDDDGGNSDVDNIDEENLSVTIDGRTFTKQEAEVHSDFDFYGDYEDFKATARLSIPAIRHYFEYRFIRSSTMPNACMKQFNKAALMAVDKWDESKLPADISTTNPVGVYPGGVDNMNSISLAWSIRTDVAIWDPTYRYVQTLNGEWNVLARSNKAFRGYNDAYKMRFIIAESDNQNSGHALGFYCPESHINEYNILGVKVADGSVIYEDNRLASAYLNDSRNRTPSMSWIGFKNEILGLIDRSKLTGAYAGVYEKVRNEYILLYGTPAEIKKAFTDLDNYYSNNTELGANKDVAEPSFTVSPNPARGLVHIKMTTTPSQVEIYNSYGKLVYASREFVSDLLLATKDIGSPGIYLIKIKDVCQKLIIYS